MLLGAHLSIAGGVTKALELAEHFGFNTIAMFVRQHRQWRPSPTITDADAELFRSMRRRLGLVRIVAHGTYLVNLAAEPEIRAKSIIATADELDRCGRLGIDYLNIHPGACPDAQLGVQLVADALNGLMAACPHHELKLLLEQTAGQGHSLGGTFEQLAAMLARVEQPDRFGVCLDTCHMIAAGYDIRTKDTYEQVMSHFDRVIGLGRLCAIHVNDSKKGLRSHVDRHAHIGQGEIGLEGFANFVNDPRLAQVPLILETPKELTEDGQEWDAVNAKTLRDLAR